MNTNDNQNFSLLYPSHIQKSELYMVDEDKNELECQCIFNEIIPEIRNNQEIYRKIKQPVYEIEVINYRLDIIDDLIGNSQFYDHFKDWLPMMNYMQFVTEKRSKERNDLLQTVMRINELRQYVDLIEKMYYAYSSVDENMKSVGLLYLKKRIIQTFEQVEFQNLIIELPIIQAKLKSIQSVTIGINLDDQMKPIQASFVSINDKDYKSPSIISKLFPISDQEFVAITPNTDIGLIKYLSENLNLILKNTLKPLRQEIEKYIEINCDWIISLAGELLFYVGSVKFIHKILGCGLPMCRPTVLPADQRICHLVNNYNISLAVQLENKFKKNLQEYIVDNNISIGETGRILILTGPNSGGKTTYAQSIGLTQFMMQLGLYVPCSEAAISPVDGMFVCFTTEETPGFETGKLGSESKRISAIIDSATSNSLILLNESFSSTSPGESYYLMKDIVSIFSIIGMRAVIATHLHELAENIEQINREVDGNSKLISMVAGLKDSSLIDSVGIRNRSYKVHPGPPQGSSYARDIALEYGISFEQMMDTVNKRNLLKNRIIN